MWKHMEGWIIPVLVATAVITALWVTPAKPHDWYSDLKQPDTGFSCCNSAATDPLGDCAPTLSRTLNGKWEALYNGMWMDVPDGKILKGVESPDGKAHLCVGKASGVVLCFIIPGIES